MKLTIKVKRNKFAIREYKSYSSLLKLKIVNFEEKIFVIINCKFALKKAKFLIKI